MPDQDENNVAEHLRNSMRADAWIWLLRPVAWSFRTESMVTLLEELIYILKSSSCTKKEAFIAVRRVTALLSALIAEADYRPQPQDHELDR